MVYFLLQVNEDVADCLSMLHYKDYLSYCYNYEASDKDVP
jgi:hypothetical protein